MSDFKVGQKVIVTRDVDVLEKFYIGSGNAERIAGKVLPITNVLGFWVRVQDPENEGFNWGITKAHVYPANVGNIAKTMPLNLRLRFLEAVRKECKAKTLSFKERLSVQCESISMALWVSFTWLESDKGGDYWANIAERYEP